MELLLSHKSALEYWRIHGASEESLTNYQLARLAPTDPPKTEAFDQFNIAGLSLPIDVTVSSRDVRLASSLINPHVTTGLLPEKSIVDVGNGLFVSSPELCFLQLAYNQELIKIIEIGFELCGSYALPVSRAVNNRTSTSNRTSNKTLYGRTSLTSVEKLSAFAESMKGTKGQLRVIESLKYLENGSASPMETVLVMLLTLPYRLGGYGLPLPKINARINPSKAARRSMSQAFYVCDLFWPDLNVAVEYDSDMFHNRTVQVDKDSRKRNSLAALGIVTITVTSQQVMSVTALERVANQLAINMGRRLQQNSNPQFGKAHQELRRKLLDFQY